MSENATFTSEIIFAVSTIAATFVYTFIQNLTRAMAPEDVSGIGGFFSAPAAPQEYHSMDLFSSPLVQGMAGFCLFTVLAASSQARDLVTCAYDLVRGQNLLPTRPYAVQRGGGGGGGVGGGSGGGGGIRQALGGDNPDLLKIAALAIISIIFVLRKVDPRPSAENPPLPLWPNPSTTQWIILVAALVFVFLLLNYCMKPSIPRRAKAKAARLLNVPTFGGSGLGRMAAARGGSSSVGNRCRRAAVLERVTVNSCANCVFLKRIGYLGLVTVALLSVVVGFMYHTRVTACGTISARSEGLVNLPTWAWATILAASLPCLIHFNPYQS